MAVYYKFKSAKDYDSISLDGHFISVAYLKEKIFETKHLGRGTDFDLVVTNAQTNEEYLDEGMLIPKNTSVLIRRVPGRPRMPIVTAPTNDQQEPEVVNKSEDANATKSSFLGPNLSVTKYPEDTEWDEFGNDLYAIPEAIPVQSSNQVPDGPPPSKADEDSKLRALIDTPALDWQHQTTDGFGTGRGFGRGMGGRMGGRGFGRGVGFERKTPPPGYVCHRCKIPGHFIQHCPTNGDPTFDVKRVKPPTGIPKSMLMATPDGSYALPSGAVAVLKPNEAAFEKEIEGMPSTRSVGDLPPELYCPLCSQVMKDAVLTSKCCFKSFCDKCIRDYIISKSTCICGATNVLADDLLPNKTLRDTICRILESNNSSGDNKGSAFHIQDMESKLHPEPKIPSPTLSATSKGEKVLPQNKDTPKLQDTEPVKIVDAPQHQDSDVMRTAKVPDVCEATHESRSVKEPAAQASAPVDEEELQQKPVSGEAGKKKKKKKTRPPSEVQWRAPQEFAPENYMMPMGPSAYNPYWTGMQPGMEVFGGPFPGPMPYMGYGLGPVPMDVPYGGYFPQDPFGPPANMMPFPPQRDLAEYGMGFNGGPPVMSRGEFEARKADLTRKRELEKRGGSRDIPKDREFSREVTSSSNVSSVKSKTKSIPLPLSIADREADFYSNRSERSPARNSRDLEPPRASSKRKVEYDHHYREELPHQHREELPYQHRETGPRASSKRKAEYDHHYEEELPVHEHREKEHGHHHHHRDKEQNRHRSDTIPKPPVRPLTTDQPPRSTSINDHKKHKPSVFSRICFPEGEVAAAASSKKRKTSSSSNDHHEDHHKNKVAAVVSKKSSGAILDDRYEYVAEYESSDDDDDRHFKRRPSRYEASEEGKHSSRVSKERERGSHSSKHSHSHR